MKIIEKKEKLEELLKRGFRPVMIATRDGHVSVYETDKFGVIYDKQRDLVIKYYEKRGPDGRSNN